MPTTRYYRPFLVIPALAFAIVVFLGSCDSATPDPLPPEDVALTGRWRIIDASVSGRVVSNLGQEAVDPSARHVTPVTISPGQVSFPYMSIIRSPSQTNYYLATEPSFTSPYVHLWEITEGLSVVYDSEQDFFFGSAPPASLNGYTLDLTGVGVKRNDDSLTFNGSLTAQTQLLSPGTVESIGRSLTLWDFEVDGSTTTLYKNSIQLDSFVSGQSRLVFNEDSTFTHEVTLQNVAYDFVGSWSDSLQESLVMDPLVPLAGAFPLSLPLTFEYAISVDTLSIHVTRPDACGDFFNRQGINCLEVFENSFFLEPNSVTSTGYDIALTYIKVQ